MKIALVIALFVADVPASCSQSPAPAAAAAPIPQVGRYVIVHSPQTEKDTMLLDTATGKTWEEIEYTDLNDSPTVWSPVPQVNTPADIAEVARIHGTKPAVTETPVEGNPFPSAPNSN